MIKTAEQIMDRLGPPDTIVRPKLLRWGLASAVAALAAGPLYLAACMAVEVPQVPQPEPWFWNAAALIGALCAGLPALYATFLLGTIGSLNRRARHPLIWCFVGTVIGYSFFPIAEGALAGGICGLLSRAIVRWSDVPTDDDTSSDAAEARKP